MKIVLYILKFQNENILKIGITTNISFRISCIEKSSGFIVDHYKSMIITNPIKKNIRLLEKNLLNITTDFQYKFEEKKYFGGINEFRKGNCVNLMLQFIKDQKDYGFKYKIYTGIDVCGQYTHTLPKAYFPIFYPVKGISSILKSDIKKYCKANGCDYYDFLNKSLYDSMKSLGYGRETEMPIKGYKNFFKV